MSGMHNWRCALCRSRGSAPTSDWAVRRLEQHYMAKHQAKT